MTTQDTKRVLVAMSGGVDSSVALLLLHQQGYQVAGATMKLWDFTEVGGDVHRDGRCCNLETMENARSVCASVGVSHYVLDFTEPFKRTVIENFVTEYRAGRTPNPCVICNTEMKWSLFLKRAMEIGCDYIATGHYARSGYDPSANRFFIRRGVDNTKDQSYALWGVEQDALAKTLFPLGDLPKTETRRLATEAGLKTALTPESMEICFVADNKYERFIREWTGEAFPEGDIVDNAGHVVGRHKGIPFYTIGQRKGLGIANPTPLYVQAIDTKSNRIVIGDQKHLDRHEMVISRINWVSWNPIDTSFTGDVQIRYQHKPKPATISPLDSNRLSIRFETAQRAITPGQSAVIYDGDTVVAGGIIE